MMQNGNVVCGTTSASRLRLDLWKLRHRASSGGEAVLRTTSQALRASSPGRGATGESVVVVLDEQSFLQSGTAGLRCFDSRLLAIYTLSERSAAAAVYSDSRAYPACQRSSSLCRYSRHLPPAGGSLSCQGSWRAQARLRGCTKRL